jgi:fructokinase
MIVMGSIYTIGETVYDIIFKDGKPVSARPGGAMLNTAVSLGRLELPVSLVTEMGEDQVGDSIAAFLRNNGVDDRYIYPFNEGKTAIALAFLDELENAHYSFYKQYPTNRLNIPFPGPEPGDIVLFGSFFALTKEVRKPLIEFITTAKENQAVIIYDPNFRPPHLKELPMVRDFIDENISLADIVRGSDEDFEMIFGTHKASEAFKMVKERGCKILVYTRGHKTTEFMSDSLSFCIEVPKIKAVSTIGAGDSFNAGLIYGIFNNPGLLMSNPVNQRDIWQKIIGTAISFGSHVCQQYDNYISKSFAVKKLEL